MFDIPIEKGLFTFYREQEQLQEMSKKVECFPNTPKKKKKQKQNDSIFIFNSKSLSNKKRSKSSTNNNDQTSPFNFNKKGKHLKIENAQNSLKQSQNDLLKYQTTYLKVFQDNEKKKEFQQKKKSTKAELNDYIRSKMTIHNMNKKLIIKPKKQLKPYSFINTNLKYSFSLPSIVQTQSSQQRQQIYRSHLLSKFVYGEQKIKNQRQKEKETSTEFHDKNLKKELNKNFIKNFRKRWSILNNRQKMQNFSLEPVNRSQSLLIDQQSSKNNSIFKQSSKNEKQKLHFHTEIKNSKLQLIQNKQTEELNQTSSENINVQSLVNTYKLKMISRKNNQEGNKDSNNNASQNHCKGGSGCNKHIKMSLLKHIRKYPVRKFQQLNKNSKSIFLICESLGLNQRVLTLNNGLNPEYQQ